MVMEYSHLVGFSLVFGGLTKISKVKITISSVWMSTSCVKYLQDQTTCQSFRNRNFPPEVYALFKHPTKKKKEIFIFEYVYVSWLHRTLVTFLKLDYKFWNVVRLLNTLCCASFLELLTSRTMSCYWEKEARCNFQKTSWIPKVWFWRTGHSCLPVRVV